MAEDWRFIAQRFNGNGLNGKVIDPELPLTDVVITRALSAPNTIEGTIDPAYLRLLDDTGRFLLKDWGTIVIAEHGTDIIGGILTTSPRSDSSVAVTIIGLMGYPNGTPYTDAWTGTEVDPLDVLRQIFDHLQSKRNGNLGLEVDPLKTGLKIGTVLKQVEFDTQAGPVSFEAGPVKLAWYETHDLGQKIDSLAEETPFDYRERWFYDPATGAVRARCELGYPELGRRHPGRFVIGENVFAVPDVSPDSAHFATEVLAIGAGEGNAALRSVTTRLDDDHVRRVAVVTDSQAKTALAIRTIANTELAWRVGKDEVTSVIVRDSEQAPLSSLEPGDHLRLQGDAGQGGELDDWFRIQTIATAVDNGAIAEISVERSDKMESAQ